jgi:hypothetical protein
MLLHLPIVILATLSPIAVSDAVPKFDIEKECHFEGGSTVVVDRCSQDEAAALRQLQAEWSRFVAVDRRACSIEATTVAGVASYVELQICLEMARDVSNGKTNPRGPLAKAESLSRQAGHPVIGVGDEHDRLR